MRYRGAGACMAQQAWVRSTISKPGSRRPAARICRSASSTAAKNSVSAPVPRCSSPRRAPFQRRGGAHEMEVVVRRRIEQRGAAARPAVDHPACRGRGREVISRAEASRAVSRDRELGGELDHRLAQRRHEAPCGKHIGQHGIGRAHGRVPHPAARATAEGAEIAASGSLRSSPRAVPPMAHRTLVASRTAPGPQISERGRTAAPAETTDDITAIGNVSRDSG